MRDILFRGKCYDTGDWVYGSFLSDIYGAKFPAILNSAEYDDGNNIAHDYHFVCPQTVGQYTGLVDKNGTKIFEGDIIQSQYDDPPEPPTLELVVWDTVAWCQKQGHHDPEPIEYDDFFLKTSMVIGNIHDNPELLEGGDE